MYPVQEPLKFPIPLTSAAFKPYLEFTKSTGILKRCRCREKGGGGGMLIKPVEEEEKTY